MSLPRFHLPFDLPMTATGAQWAKTALQDLDAVLSDHFHCERKAAQSALSLARLYPHRQDLVVAVTRLAHEETRHVVQVMNIVTDRGHELARDLRDDYAVALRGEVRKLEPGRLLDLLLVSALIEARSAERLALLSEALDDSEPKLSRFYAGLAIAEERHRDLFLQLAWDTNSTEFESRASVLSEREGQIVAEQPILPRIH